MSMRRRRPTTSDRVRRTFGVNVVGYITGNLGLGVSTRQTIRLLERAGVPVALTDLDPGLGRGGHDLTSVLSHPANLGRTPHPVTLFHLNPGELGEVVRVQPRLTRSDRVTAIVPFWELQVLPDTWLPILEAVDVVLTPTRFIRTCIEDALPDVICIDYPQMVYGCEDSSPDRARWGMQADSTAFVTSFDLASDIERKNPRAVVAAFQHAFPGRDDVQLIVKANSVAALGDDSGLWGELVRLIQGDDRMRLITEPLPYADVMSLYASADCMVSLHRSEGLGLSLMEAMLLAKPVIATGWSGNLDFMTPANSLLVDFELIPVVSDHPAYAGFDGRGAVWADASIESAAHHMQAVADDPVASRFLGLRAQQDLLELRARLERGEVVERIREAVAPDSAVWRAHDSRRARLRALAKGSEAAAWASRARRLPAPVRNLARPGVRQLRAFRSRSAPDQPSKPNESHVRHPRPGPVDMDRFFAEFSDEFRGTVDTITQRLHVYVPQIKALTPVKEGARVIDLGCGRGELLQVLKTAGVAAVGVDTNAAAVGRAVAKGMDADVADGLAYLKAQASGTLGAVTGIHIVEHLTLEERLAIFSECYRALAPGGAVIFETPNPQSAQVGAYTFWLDPSHLQPVPPQLLDFSLRFCGFQTETLYLQPLKPDAKPRGRYLREVHASMYGFADYAVIGRKPE